MKARGFLYICVLAVSACALLLFPAPPAWAEIKYQHIPGPKRVPKYPTSRTLDKNSITRFINDVHNVVKTGSQNMTPDEIATYFSRHIADGAEFSSEMSYEMPGYPPQYSALRINKIEYINGILNGTGLMEDYEQDLQVQNITLGPGKRSALVKILIHEKGKMPWPKDQPNPESPPEMVPLPVKGLSECEQNLVLSRDNIIQMQKAQCRTTLSFDVFKDTELGPDMFFNR